jgi:hypothetical protein
VVAAFSLVLYGAFGVNQKAAAATFCVHRAHCRGVRAPSLSVALDRANANGGRRDVILLGAGRFRAGDDIRGNPVDIVGVGAGTLIRSSLEESDRGFSALLIEDPQSRLSHVRVRGRGHGALGLAGQAEYIDLGRERLNLGTEGGLFHARSGSVRGIGGGRVEDSSIVGTVSNVSAVRRSRLRTSPQVDSGDGIHDVTDVSDTVIRVTGAGVGYIADPCGGQRSAYGTAGQYTVQNVTIVGTPGAGGTGVLATYRSRDECPASVDVLLSDSIIMSVSHSVRREGAPSSCQPSVRSACGGAAISVGRCDFDARTVTDEGSGSYDSANDFLADPRFVNAHAGDFRLRFDSPLVDGTRVERPGRDAAGHRRTVDGNRDGVTVEDLGALEYQGSGPRVRLSVPRRVRLGTRALFSAARTTDPDGGPLRFEWRFGDGRSARGVRSRHAFHRRGRFRVWVTVTNLARQEAVTSRVVNVR